MTNKDPQAMQRLTIGFNGNQNLDVTLSNASTEHCIDGLAAGRPQTIPANETTITVFPQNITYIQQQPTNP